MGPTSTSISRAAITTAESDIEALIEAVYLDRPLAHSVFFPHEFETSPAHEDLIRNIHNPPSPYLLVEGFRGFAKSTTAEEAIALKAGFKEFRNCLIVGSRVDLASERLTSIRNHIENNLLFVEAFGYLRGPTWADEEVVLSTGARILAVGRGQSLLGIKYLDHRPDLVLIDDLEKPEEALSETARKEAHKWLITTLIPALDPDARIIFLGTQRDPSDVIGLIKADIEQARAEGVVSEFSAVKYPIEYNDLEGKRTATWEARWPLDRIDRRRSMYIRQGKLREFNIEYMCVVEATEDKNFRADMLRVEPQVRTWQAVYTMHDPARTVGAKSAHTGFAAWSYVGPKIVVWRAWGKLLMPNEIVESLFAENEALNPTFMGFEVDGLNEWAMQPIRQEQLRRRVILPLKPMKAPAGKLDFIRGLQTYASARELIFAEPLPDLKTQLLNFPSGRIDVPNALAYALRMKPGAQMYEDFTGENVMEGLKPNNRQLHLVTNAGHGLVASMLVQFQDGALRVFADWVREGDPDQVFRDIVNEAALFAGRGFIHVCPPLHFEIYNNVGLVQAGKRLGLDFRTGTDPARGRTQVRELLKRRSRGYADLVVGSAAKWTINGFSSGYARALGKNGTLADYADEGPYRVLMEGLESFSGLMTLGMDGHDDRNYRTTADGTRYASTLRDRR